MQTENYKATPTAAEVNLTQRRSALVKLLGMTDDVLAAMAKAMRMSEDDVLQVIIAKIPPAGCSVPSGTPNIDIMLKQVERKETQDMFRPFLIRQIYSYLVGKAFLGHTTTYENIANEFGLPNKGNQLGSTLSPLLSSIYKFCRQHHQPMLTVIVVRKSGEHKDLPGNGFWSLYNDMLVAPVVTIEERREYTRSLQTQVFEYWGGLGQ